MQLRRTPLSLPRSTPARKLAGALIAIALSARPAAAVTGLVEANGKAVTTFAGCKRSAGSLTLPIRFLSDSQWQASLGAVTPSGTYDAASTRRATTIPFTLDDASRGALLAELQARATAACGHAISLQSITLRTFRGRIDSRRGKVTVKLVVAMGGTGKRERGAFRFAGRGTLGPLPTTTTTTSTSSTTSTTLPCTEFNVDGCPVTSEGEGVDERTNDDFQSAVQAAIGSRIEGTIGNPTADGPDYDLFKFDAVAGDHLRVTISDRAGGTYQAFGAVLTSAGDGYRISRPGTSDTSIAIREFYIGESGEYALLIADLRNQGSAPGTDVGGPTLTYRAEITRVSRAPTPLTPLVVNRAGSVPVTGDVTAFSFTATLGEGVTALTRALRLPTPSKVDTYLMLFDASTTPPTLVASNDDVDFQSGNTDSEIGSMAPASGPYLLVVDYYDVRGITPEDRAWDVSLGTGPFCANHIRNGDESDVDCGGSLCPACPLTKSCNQDGDCVSGSCKPDHACGCPSTSPVFTVISSDASLFETAQWPGGTQTFAPTSECSVTIGNPSGGIGPFSSGSPFSVVGNVGFATCVGAGGEDGDGCQPLSCPTLGIGSCAGARPSCTVGNNGSGSARYAVQCRACSHTCRADQLCTNDVCDCPGTTTDCGSTCADTATDPHNCGACGATCAGQQVCTNGRCGQP